MPKSVQNPTDTKASMLCFFPLNSLPFPTNTKKSVDTWLPRSVRVSIMLTRKSHAFYWVRIKLYLNKDPTSQRTIVVCGDSKKCAGKPENVHTRQHVCNSQNQHGELCSTTTPITSANLLTSLGPQLRQTQLSPMYQTLSQFWCSWTWNVW